MQFRVLLWALLGSLLFRIPISEAVQPEPVSQASISTCISLKSGTQVISRTGKCNSRIYEKREWFTKEGLPFGLASSKILELKICTSLKSGTRIISKKPNCNPSTQSSINYYRRIGPPAAPSIKSITMGLQGSATLAIDAPPEDGGSIVTSYAVTASPGEKVTTISPSKTMKIVGLDPGTRYTFKVAAKNKFGISEFSQSSDPLLAPTVPGSPQITQARATGYSSAEITFTAPTSDGGSSITSFKVTSSPGDLQTILNSGSSRTALINNLSPATTYRFTLKAINAAGESLPSELSVEVTTASPPPPIEVSPPPSSSPSVALPAFTLSSSSLTRIANETGDGITVNSTGGLIASFTISSQIPGMNFNTSTGELAGVPTQVSGYQNYVITGQNASGSSSATFSFRVEGQEVAGIVFSLSSVSETVTAGSAITGYSINSTGGAIANFTLISPLVLPPGLAFDRDTGILSGTPTESAGATEFVLEATNLNDIERQTFTLTVLSLASKVAITRASVGTESGVAFTTQPRITIQDSSNNTVLSSTATVTATISAGGTLVGTTTATASAGVATFTNLGVSGDVGTTYTITYTSVGLTVATVTVKVSRYCDGSFACNVGDTGPGGGVIFYAAPTGFLCGATLDNLCRYLEAAPLEGASAWSEIETNWSGNVTDSVTTSVSIGEGYKNTLAILAMGSGGSAPGKAGTSARAFQGPNNKEDWFLPSKDELNELYLNRVIAGGFDRAYWSSSEYYNGTVAWIQYPDGPFNAGLQGGATKDSTVSARPIRAFGDWMSPNSRFKGQAITSFGSAYASYNGALNGHAGSVTLTALQASDTSTVLSNVTNFLSLNSGVDVEVQISRLTNASGGTYALPVYYDNDDFEKVGRGDYLMIRVNLNGYFAYYRVNILVEYAVGDIGPGGGRIFYKSLSSFTCGTNADKQCNYLEVAPTSGATPWPTNPVEVWGIPPLIGSSLGTGTAIGTGFRNTTLMIAFDAQQGGATTSSTVLTSYRTLSEFKDWYLPSLNELLALKTFVGASDSENQAYWSSSESTWQNGWQVRFTDGGSQEVGKSATGNVARAIRSF